MLIDILSRLSADTGLHVEQKRTLLLTYINHAAKELHKKLECNRMHREMTVAVPSNKIISLPSLVGETKGFRFTEHAATIDLESLNQPKYTSNVETFKLTNFRDLGDSPVHTLPQNIGKLKVYPKGIESSPITLCISGATNSAARVEERILVNNIAGHETMKLFTPDINSIMCASNRTYDIVIKDAAENEIAVLNNNERRTRYKLIDVSEFGWTSDTDNNETLIDVLYKVPATELINDSDMFYTDDESYDEAWYCMAMHLFLDPLKDRKEDSMIYRGKCTDLLREAKESSEGNIVKRINYPSNKYFDIQDMSLKDCWSEYKW